ncbi:MAG: hypothetical protein LBJ10_08280 [Clostridiales bacterium]|nr:hypothetical protein [Clostridiales bacterium]
MTYSFIIANRQGLAYDFASSVESVEHATERAGAAGRLEFTLWKTAEASFHEGDAVQFYADGERVFAGTVFKKSRTGEGQVTATCYDRLRYLKASASYDFDGYSADGVVRRIAADLGLPLGEIEETGYPLPGFRREDKGCLDIISYAVDLTAVALGEAFVFLDDGDGLSLRRATSLAHSEVLGERSRIGGYAYETSIDGETYNSIKLVRPNEATGGADAYVMEDVSTQGLWGTLRLYEKVDENMNDAQILDRLKRYMAYYNRPTRKLSLEGAIGVIGMNAGHMALIDLPDMGDVGFTGAALIDKATHAFGDGLHTMDLEMEVILPDEGGDGSWS